ETGKVEILRIVSATDVGKAINPSNVEGQIEGGVAMGIGYALTEEIKLEGGYLKSRNLGECYLNKIRSPNYIFHSPSYQKET
ncbi:MAG: molybdopterin-dependent oxidoreductase, partial [Proteobacteria bacterium]|nr:molybdopterin-dependent oxidoreductase [Pseudomonadota bacterium]